MVGCVECASRLCLPLAPVRSHYWIAEPDPAFGSGMAGDKAGQHPITILLDAATYTRPELGGLVIGVQESRSATFDARELPDDPATFSTDMGEDHWDALIDAFTCIESLCPAIHEARFSSYLAGLSTYTPDGQLVLGEVPGNKGIVCGFRMLRQRRHVIRRHWRSRCKPAAGPGPAL